MKIYTGPTSLECESRDSQFSASGCVLQLGPGVAPGAVALTSRTTCSDPPTACAVAVPPTRTTAVATAAIARRFFECHHRFSFALYTPHDSSNAPLGAVHTSVGVNHDA